MHEKLYMVKEIERLMAPVLDGSQLEKLHAVLTHCLPEIDDLATKQNRFGNNTQIIEAFLAAKSIEGCSSRTIGYYSATLRAFAATLDKPFIEVTTDDARSYLAFCQCDGQVSNVAVDNIRRIISSLFSWLECEDIVYKSPVRRIKKVRAPKTSSRLFPTNQSNDRATDAKACAILQWSTFFHRQECALVSSFSLTRPTSTSRGVNAWRTEKGPKNARFTLMHEPRSI